MERTGGRLTAPVEIHDPGIELPKECLVDPVQGEGEELYQVDQETAYDEGKNQHNHRNLSLFQPP